MPSYKLVYFPTMGRAEPIRLTFAQADVPYEDHRIKFEDWVSVVKPTAPMGSVPFLEIDGKTKLSQTHAICGYIGQLHDLAGKGSFESAQCYMYAGGVEDLWVAMTPYFLSTDPEQKVKMYADLVIKKVKPFLERYEKFLADNGTGFFVGDGVTWADLVVFHCIWFMSKEDKEHVKLADYPKLEKFLQTISSLAKIKSWLEKRPKTDW